MTRSFFLYISRQAQVRALVTHFTVARKTAQRFVAGETPEEGITAIRALNAKGILATVDCLGENVTTEADACRARDAYLQMLDYIAQAGVKSHVSLKLTMFGLDLDFNLCRDNVAAVVERARAQGAFVRLDIEDHTYTDRTIEMMRTLRRDCGCTELGMALQAYLYRTEADLRALANEGINVRLCKGAYAEPPDVAFPRKADVDANMVNLMRLYLSEESRAHGAYLAMATHDEKMIEATKLYVAEHRIPRDAFEFQMLYGIRRDLQERLVAEGYKMRVYVPYGTEWYPYLMRRMAERPANVWFIASNFFRR